ncbi:MAG: FtsQ-type POTRA domain-containing protein [Firmicutes bacterium]|nr:FtsQ-type POTRA domain-containing protein [Bacillota bacterium]
MASTAGKHRKKKHSNRAMREEVNNARRQKAEKPVTLVGFFLPIGIILAVFFVMYLVLANSGIKVEKIDVVGNKVITEEDVISLCGISEGNDLFRTDTVAAENQIRMHVIIDDVNVRVRPFDTVLIEITEKDAVAGFMVDDTYFYLDARKVVVAESDTVDEVLPLFSGFDLPSFVSIGLPLEDPRLDSDLKIADAVKGHFKGYQLEICAVSDSENLIYVNGIEVRLGSLGRLDAKIAALEGVLNSMSVQKLESLEYIDVSLPDDPVLMERPLGADEEVEEEEDDDTKSSKPKDTNKPGNNHRDTTEAE